MDEQTEVTDYPTVGERLRAAREDKGFSLEDIAAETRIPLRHLENVEAANWTELPAPTYTIGFAKSYASAVGLDRAEIGEQLRSEMGGYRNDSSAVEHFEPVDPARAMPRWLIIGAIAAIILIVLIFAWVRSASLSEEPPPAPIEQPAQQQPQPAAGTPQQAQPQQAQGPVVITATGPAWVRVTDGSAKLFEGMMQPGQTYQVPPTAKAPMLRVGAPEAIRVNVGNAVAPPVGPAGQVTSDVSLLPQDLMRGPNAQPPAQPAQPAANPAGQ
jgi:cytoskeletal protein RodZ